MLLLQVVWFRKDIPFLIQLVLKYSFYELSYLTAVWIQRSINISPGFLLQLNLSNCLTTSVELPDHFRPEQKLPKRLLNSGKPGALTIFLGNLFQCLTTLSCPNKHYLRIPENKNDFLTPVLLFSLLPPSLQILFDCIQEADLTMWPTVTLSHLPMAGGLKEMIFKAPSNTDPSVYKV